MFNLSLKDVNNKERKVKLNRKMLREQMKEIVQNTIKQNQSIGNSVTANKLRESIHEELNLAPEKSYIYGLVKELVNAGENIISLRWGDLKGYRYSTSPMEYSAAIRENNIFTEAYMRRGNKLQERYVEFMNKGGK